jgi:arabinan endo-1,5-alpha-L-arabinosidase
MCFSTGAGPNHDGEIPLRCSKDLRVWTRCGNVLERIPEWILKESPSTKNLLGARHLLFLMASITFTTRFPSLERTHRESPCLQTKPWTQRTETSNGKIAVWCSNQENRTISMPLIPTSWWMREGHAWLAFGSFWDGIKLRSIDDQSGKLSSSDTQIYSVARRKPPDSPPPNPPGLPANWQAIDGPLYCASLVPTSTCLSRLTCAAGGRKAPTDHGRTLPQSDGPYLDANGTPMLEGGGTPVLLGNDRWLGPGGLSIRMGNEHGLGETIMTSSCSMPMTARQDIRTCGSRISTGQAVWPHLALEGGNSAPQ